MVKLILSTSPYTGCTFWARLVSWRNARAHPGVGSSNLPSARTRRSTPGTRWRTNSGEIPCHTATIARLPQARFEDQSTSDRGSDPQTNVDDRVLFVDNEVLLVATVQATLRPRRRTSQSVLVPSHAGLLGCTQILQRHFGAHL